MSILQGITPDAVFKYFEEISAVPRGSGHREKIADYCENFAKEHGLRYYRDSANNVVIYKDASKGYENSAPIIIQGHLDMVWQKAEGLEKNLLEEGIDLKIEGDYITAEGTTLGADNGIAVAMAMAVLVDNTICHPPIEAVFTTDEEVGMLGAKELDTRVLASKRMINIDSEEPGVITVSCAGGSDFTLKIPFAREKAVGEKVVISLKGLKGGHSGIEINSGRANANIFAGRILAHLSKNHDFGLQSVLGGNRANAIANACEISLVCENGNALLEDAKAYISDIKEEISAREEDFFAEFEFFEKESYACLPKEAQDKVIYALALAPNGVQEMSGEIDNLVETSLNLGILDTNDSQVTMAFALRSSKKTALFALSEKLQMFAKCLDVEYAEAGYYPPWEYNKESEMKQLCCRIFEEKYGYEPKIEAIHAGLECAVFSGTIEGFDCISIGPEVIGAHTIEEKLSISSAKEVYDLLIKILENCR